MQISIQYYAAHQNSSNNIHCIRATQTHTETCDYSRYSVSAHCDYIFLVFAPNEYTLSK